MSTWGRNTNQNLAKPGMVSGPWRPMPAWASGQVLTQLGAALQTALQTLRPAPGTGLPKKTFLPDLMLDWGDWFFQKEALAPHSCQIHHDHWQSTHKPKKPEPASAPPFPNTRPTTPLPWLGGISLVLLETPLPSDKRQSKRYFPFLQTHRWETYTGLKMTKPKRGLTSQHSPQLCYSVVQKGYTPGRHVNA